jgi:hypothetical protein
VHGWAPRRDQCPFGHHDRYRVPIPGPRERSGAFIIRRGIDYTVLKVNWTVKSAGSECSTDPESSHSMHVELIKA